MMNQKDIIAQLRADLHDDAQYMRLDAIQQLARIRTPDTIPALIDGLLLDDSFVNNIAADALIEIGSPTIGALIAILPETKGRTCIRVLQVLAHADDERTLPYIVPYLESTDQRIQHTAIEAIGTIGSPLGIPALEQHMFDSDAQTRQRVVIALNAIGGVEAIEQLVKILRHDTNTLLRRNAALSIAENHRHAHDAIRVLLEALRDPDGDVRAAVTNALAAMGNPAIDALIESLLTGERSAQMAVGRALVSIGEPAIPALQHLIESDHYPMAATAAVILSEMGEIALDILIEGLGSHQETTRHAAALALENIQDARVDEALRRFRRD